MLKDQNIKKSSVHSELYNLIPENHILRKINEAVDFSFIHELVKESYDVFYGRPANDPEVLFRLLFLQNLYQLSDRQVITDCQVNLAYKWFLGLNPEDPLPDPSQLSRFRRNRLGVAGVERVLAHIVQQCVQQGLIRSKSIIVDSTHMIANASKQKPKDVLITAATRLRRVVKKYQPKLIEKLSKLPSQKASEEEWMAFLVLLTKQVKQYVPDAEGALKDKLEVADKIIHDERLLLQKGVQSAIDPDARIGKKSSTRSFFGYKLHLAMTEDEIITGAQITTGSADDGKQLIPLISNTLKQGVVCHEVLGDTAYSSKINLTWLNERSIIPTIPLNPIVFHGTRNNDQSFRYDKEVDAVECPAGNWSIRKARNGKTGTNVNTVTTFYFDVNKCKNCSLQNGCYQGSSTKTFSIRNVCNEHQAQIDYMKSSLFSLRSKKRRRIEHKNAEIKRFHGLTRAKYWGLFGVTIQAVLTTFVVNVKRMVQLLAKKKHFLICRIRKRFFIFSYEPFWFQKL
jgi:transposase